MNINIKKEMAIGAVIGLIANLVGMFLFIAIFVDEDFERTVSTAYQTGILGKFMALGAVLNFAPFYMFLRRNLIYRARGVVVATVLVAITTLVLYFQ
ncbi:MAG: hypothetical protein LAT51_11930 [Flavobacteriaceae bacterium]|nr:hypothetical protein [Flavobacteriaceae bacterium]